MKLLQKTGRIYLFFTAILLLIAGLMLYGLMTRFVGEEITEKLIANKERVVKRLELGEPVPQLPPVLEIERAFNSTEAYLIIKDTTLFDPVEKEPELFREVTSVELTDGVFYRITLRQVILEPADFLNNIGISIAVVILFLLIGLYWLNRIISKKIWDPFYQNLDILKRFSLAENQPIKLQPSDIDEFAELNRAVENLTEKVRNDYHLLKEFTENASHEMQTPLAIIRSKLEEAFQDSDLSEQQATQLEGALAAVRRLSGLNQTLLLLARIENRQFKAVEKVKLLETIQKVFGQFEDFIESKNISVENSFLSDATLITNPQLFETMLVNLIGNAIKFSEKEGKIKIEGDNNKLSITNSAPPLTQDPEKMFDRFVKADPSTSSPGLGLSIVKKICDIYGWKINYTVLRNEHTLTIRF